MEEKKKQIKFFRICEFIKPLRFVKRFFYVVFHYRNITVIIITYGVSLKEFRYERRIIIQTSYPQTRVTVTLEPPSRIFAKDEGIFII